MTRIYNYFKRIFPKDLNSFKSFKVFIYLIAALLISIPLNYAIGSVISILFIIISFATIQKVNFTFNKALALPIIFYCIMIASLLWTRDLQLTIAGLQKEILFLFIPVAFLFKPKISKDGVTKIISLFSYAMVFYALYYFIKAIIKYIESKNIEVFFYHNLVTLDLNAIYVSVFASFALFYFISIKNKKLIEQLATAVLLVLVFLLSSKSVIFIDVLLIIFYYTFFSSTPKTVRFLTVITFMCFLLFSLIFVKQIRERFLIEYETAFVDNTINKNIESNNQKVYNVSLKQAWNNQKFQHNNFFPGTALRIYQIRIFKEMLYEENILFTGLGLETSQQKIRDKAIEHNLFPAYGDFNFHNQYVQTFAELGLFGFLTLIAMLYCNIKNAWDTKNFIHIVFAIIMIILFLTESFFCRQRGIIFFITVYCMFNENNNIKKKI